MEIVIIVTVILVWSFVGIFTWVDVQIKLGWFNIDIFRELFGLFACIVLGPIALIDWQIYKKKNQ